MFSNVYILPSKTQHMYTNALMKYRLHQFVYKCYP